MFQNHRGIDGCKGGIEKRKSHCEAFRELAGCSWNSFCGPLSFIVELVVGMGGHDSESQFSLPQLASDLVAVFAAALPRSCVRACADTRGSGRDYVYDFAVVLTCVYPECLFDSTKYTYIKLETTFGVLI
jgi:hypothetical protein